jgi:hypothetical protein
MPPISTTATAATSETLRRFIPRLSSCQMHCPEQTKSIFSITRTSCRNPPHVAESLLYLLEVVNPGAGDQGRSRGLRWIGSASGPEHRGEGGGIRHARPRTRPRAGLLPRGHPVRAGREGPMRDLAAMPGHGATVKTHAKTLCGRPGKPPGETMEDCRPITPGISASH